MKLEVMGLWPIEQGWIALDEMLLPKGLPCLGVPNAQFSKFLHRQPGFREGDF